MRKNLARALCTVAFVGLAVSGCKFQASAKGGTDDPKPPPPAPAPAPAPAPVEKRPIPKLSFKVNEKGEVQLPGPVLFETGTANLKPESDAVLEVVQKYLEAKPEITKLRVEGHTDTDGDDNSNFTLSKNRSMACVKWLVAKGIDCNRLVPVGFGESRLLKKPEVTPEDKAQNRRTMFINAEINGKAIGGLPLDGGGQPAGNSCQ
jgi:OOP family OmpA-OmpF porin